MIIFYIVIGLSIAILLVLCIRSKFKKPDLWELAARKDKLKKKLKKINEEIAQINNQALSYKGTKGWGQDLFIRCLVEDLHFEQMPDVDAKKG